MALFSVHPTRTDIVIARAVTRRARPVPEEVAGALSWGADEKVLLLLATAGWLCTRRGSETARRAGNHALVVAVTTSLLPHLIKHAVDQTRPDRLTLFGHLHGIPLSGRRKDAFPSGHALHMGALASAASAMSPLPRAAGYAIAVGLSLTRVLVLAHWASDVLVGFAAGTLTERVLRRWTGYPAGQRNAVASPPPPRNRSITMSVLETIKKIAERTTTLGRPGKHEAVARVRPRTPMALHFRDDGFIPNHPRWPLVIYEGAVHLDEACDPAAVMEDLFSAHGWADSWRNGIYDYVHYHSRIHEVLGVARGHARVRFGGNNGRIVSLKAGDVAVLPAGTGHQCLSASEDFLVVGAYPPSGTYDVCTNIEDRASAIKTIPTVAAPAEDPVYGREGPLLAAWRQPD